MQNRALRLRKENEPACGDLRQAEALARMRDKLDGCIGCGCLSLRNCALYNPQDRAAKSGAGPRFVLAETPKTAGRRVKA